MSATWDIKKQTKGLASLSKKRASPDRNNGARQTHTAPGSTRVMQRYLGNSYLQSGPQTTIRRKECDGSCGGTCPSCKRRKELAERGQTKLTIGPADDIYEREADQVAEQVMQMPSLLSQHDPGVSRSQFNIQRISTDSELSSLEVNSDLQLNQSSGRPLSLATRHFMEPRFGADFSQVRLHTDQKAQQTATQIRARAFTYGNHIWLGEGEREQDKSLIAHELTHVIQQAGHRSPKASFIQRDEVKDTKQTNNKTCSMTAKRETTRTGFCINGTTNASDGTRVSFHYIPGMTSCNRGDLSIMPPFGTTTVLGGRFSWRAPTNLGSPIPGVGRLFGAIIGSAVCCTRPRPGRC